MKTLIPRLAAATILVASLALTAPAAESLSVLLQKGIYAEETEGNLDSAIKIYEQITAESATNRSVVAQAQYRLAVCYQKKGDKEQAIKLLNELVQQFPSDVALTQKARTTLVELGVTPPEAVSVRKLVLPIQTDWIMSISQDGRFVTCTRKGSYDIAVCEVPTGKSWIVEKGTKESTSWGATEVSPDGQWILYQFSATTIAISKIDGSEKRTLHEGEKAKESLWLEGWSPDSKHVMVGSYAVTSRPVNTGSSNVVLFALDVKTGAKKDIVRMSRVNKNTTGYARLNEPGFGWSAEVSSDGDYVARRSRAGTPRIGIWDLKSNHEEVVVERDAEHVFGWFAGNTKLLYSKSRAGGIDLWATPVRNGKPSGEPELVCSNIGDVRPLAIARDGTIYGCSSEVLWVMEGFLSRTDPQKYIGANTHVTPSHVAEFIGPNNSIFDRKTGIAAICPEGWRLNSAVRPIDGLWSFTFHFGVPGETKARPYFIALRDSKLIPAAEVDVWLRTWADTTFVEHRKKGADTSYKDAEYKNVPGSFSSRTIAGHRALSWVGEFKRDGENWIELTTLIYSEKAPGFILLRTPASDVEGLRAGYEALVESVRVP